MGAKNHGSCRVTNINRLVANKKYRKYLIFHYITAEVAEYIKWCVEQDFNVYDITISK